MTLVWAAPPTRDTEIPALIAGRTPALNSEVSRKQSTAAISPSLVATPVTLANLHGSTSETRTGWAAGVGGEWAVAAHWTVKAEYLNVDLGTTTVTSLDAAQVKPVGAPAPLPRQ